MKSAVICLLAFAVVAVSAGPQYTTKYDNIDLDQILRNERLLKPYINCLLHDGPCTADARELKGALPDALATECAKCSEKQKQGSEKVIKYLSENKPEVWTKILAKFDPENKYRTKYEERAKKIGIST